MDETTLLLTLVFFAPLGLITLLQVVEAGLQSSWRRESSAPSQMRVARASTHPS